MNDQPDTPGPAELEPVSTRLPTPDECFMMYLALGHQRSLEAVVEKSRERGFGVAPHVSTLKKWATKYRWAPRLRAAEIQIATKAQEKLVDNLSTTAANDLSALAPKMRDIGWKMLVMLEEAVTPKGKKRAPLLIRHGGDYKAMAESAAGLFKAAEILDGGGRPPGGMPMIGQHVSAAGAQTDSSQQGEDAAPAAVTVQEKVDHVAERVRSIMASVSQRHDAPEPDEEG